MSRAPAVTTVLTISGHRQAAVDDSADFRSWSALGDRLGQVWCVWAGPHLASDQGSLHVVRRPRVPGWRSIPWVVAAAWSGCRIVNTAKKRGETVVVNGGEPWGWLTAWLVSMVTRRPWLMDVHGDYLNLPVASVGRWRKFGLRRATIFFARNASCRRVVAQSILDSFRMREISAILVPPRLMPVWEEPLERARPPLADGELSLLVVGRLVPSKGYDLLLQSLALLVADLPKVRLRVVGEGPERLKLEARAAELGVSDAVEFLGAGNVDDVRSALAISDLFIISSRDEGLPRTLLEAAAGGVPVVATSVGGIPAAAVEWMTVSVVPVEARAIAAAIREMAEVPPSAEELQAVRQKVLAAYGFGTNLDALAAVYREMVADDEVARGRETSTST